MPESGIERMHVGIVRPVMFHSATSYVDDDDKNHEFLYIS